ncbi:MAG: right-handed parallel beta-helix repeat-containing protein [Myxococcales bacterium]|nr:right-handed parallel beta-helix repeat-containing protein [Myxococcales bacterium]
MRSSTLVLGTLLLWLVVGCSSSSHSNGDAAQASDVDVQETTEDVHDATSDLTNPSGDTSADSQRPPDTTPTTYPGFLPIDCKHVGNGTDYPVGPEQAYKTLSEVPWNTLGPGDTVRLFWRAEPYREKVLLRGKGTKEQPIRFCGVPGPEGQLPVISGDGATTRQDLLFGGWRPIEDLGLITIWDNEWESKPANIVIEGLALTQASQNYAYTGTDGVVGPYSEGAACIWVQEGDNVVIRGNTITDCGNGIFTMSKPDNEGALTRDILIEGNYLYNNGTVGSYLQHNLYVQAVGAIYQYNYFGRNRPGAEGGNLKDRSAGTIVRYNYFEGGLRQLDLVEVQEHAPLVIGVPGTEERYRKAYVYGNLIRVVGSLDGSRIIHYGFDSIPENTRKGTLYCFNNTILMQSDQSDSWRQRVLDISTNEETVEFFNNIVLIMPETAGQTPSELNLLAEAGVVNLGANLISKGYIEGFNTNGTLNGEENLIEIADPSSVIDPKTLAPVPGSPALDASIPLPDTLSEHPLLYQYKERQQGELRPTCGSALDFGALERCP